MMMNLRNSEFLAAVMRECSKYLTRRADLHTPARVTTVKCNVLQRLKCSGNALVDMRISEVPSRVNLHRCIHTSTFLSSKKSRPARVTDDAEGDEKKDEFEGDDIELTPGEKVVNVRVLSDRLDAVMKTGFQMSRNKIEKTMYADLIRVNGVRPKKKSMLVGEGDEIDLILRYNEKNPAFLDVNRLEILQMGQYSRTEDEDSDAEAKLPCKIKRSRNLTIENYAIPFKGNIDNK